jgi:hypothetical protein
MTKYQITVTNTEDGTIVKEYPNVDAFILAVSDGLAGEMTCAGPPLYLIESGANIINAGIEANKQMLRGFEAEQVKARAKLLARGKGPLGLI